MTKLRDVEVLSQCPGCGASGPLARLEPPAVSIGSEQFSQIAGVLGLKRCGHCGLRFINPRPSEALLVDFYQDPLYDCHQNSYAEEDMQDAATRLQIIERHANRESLLDFGCGAGALITTARRRGWTTVVGVELGRNMRARLISEGHEVYPDLETSQLVHSRWSAVTMIHVLEHLVDPSHVLRKVHELLATDGVLMIEVPNADSLRARIAASRINHLLPRAGQRYQAYPIHLFYFNLRSLTELLRVHGFEVIEANAIGLGVDEFLPHQRPAAGGARTGTAETGSMRSGRGTSLKSRVMSAGKTMIKSVMSELMLGEHLLVTCRKRNRIG